MSMDNRVYVKMPWSDNRNLPQDMVNWLRTHVGQVISPPPVNSVGENWRRVRFILGEFDQETVYVFEFDEARHAVLFKLTWG